MASECELGLRIERRGGGGGGGGGFFLQNFKLYETQSKFYLVGRDKSRTHWRVLTIDRLEPLELNIREDPTVYSESECIDLLRRINEGNVYIGGLKFVTVCYGIVGFVKFLGPYYMLLITRRKLTGTIHGHAIYAITKTEMIVLPNSTVRCNMINTKDENRYKKLLRTVDLTKDFFFSYSYGVMHSLQKNLCGNQKSQICYDTMFVWNEFLTAGVRKHLGSTIWTVALVYGFFKQVKFSISGKDFNLTLICRRSRHYAGPRYLKRGVNEKGRVANDVETEQIVFEYVHGGYSTQIASVVQHRGSIPLFWSQETSRLNIKPDIILQKKDQKFEATKLHFENLDRRYGNPIIVWNLIKTHEKKPRESILRAEFANAIETINKSLPEDKHIRFLHWDLSKHSKSKPTQVLESLSRIAKYALTLTGFFYCHQVTPALTLPDAANWNSNRASEGTLNENSNVSQNSSVTENGSDELKLQNGILRTNCIDCLDRTNVAQYAFGLAALGHQLRALGFIDHPRISLNDCLADELMTLYEIMGDTLALQYGGSPAHNKIFSERRGQWKAATQSQEFLRTLQRYYSNAWMDAEKQRAINVFLGYFLPQPGKHALWELDSDQHCNVGRRENTFANENSRSLFKRSLSDGNILCENNTAVLGTQIAPKKLVNCPLPDKITQEECKDLSDITAEATNCESDTSYSRYTPEVVRRQLFLENAQGEYESNYSNFLDFDLLSSSGNSCDEDFERSSLVNSPLAGCSSENISGTPGESAALRASSNSITKEADVRSIPLEFSDRFKNWILHGEMLAYDEFISTP